jgi:hypothetical protein
MKSGSSRRCHLAHGLEDEQKHDSGQGTSRSHRDKAVKHVETSEKHSRLLVALWSVINQLNRTSKIGGKVPLPP